MIKQSQVKLSLFNQQECGAEKFYNILLWLTFRVSAINQPDGCRKGLIELGTHLNKLNHTGWILIYVLG